MTYVYGPNAVALSILAQPNRTLRTAELPLDLSGHWVGLRTACAFAALYGLLVVGFCL
jgi:hypothetical protein